MIAGLPRGAGPLCPVCRAAGRVSLLEAPQGEILEGILGCPEPACRREYPVVDGVPLLFADLVAVMAAQGSLLLARQDLSAEMETLLGDALGPGSAYDNARQHLSTYGAAHWGDLAAPPDAAAAASAASFRALVEEALRLAAPPEGLLLDLGCALGRGVALLAEKANGPVLGIDLHLGLLRAAAAARRGPFSLPRRELGLVYHRVAVAEGPLAAGREGCDFWAADAARLPLADGAAAGILAMNLLDCAASPWELVLEMARVLRPGGILWLATPWDWSASATPFAAWLGGHSQRGGRGGDSGAILRDLLSGRHPGAPALFTLLGEAPRLPWRLRLHARSTVEYAVDLLVLRRVAGGEV